VESWVVAAGRGRVRERGAGRGGAGGAGVGAGAGAGVVVVGVVGVGGGGEDAHSLLGLLLLPRVYLAVHGVLVLVKQRRLITLVVGACARGGRRVAIALRRS